MKFTQDSSEMIKGENFDYVLISEERNITLTFSEIQDAFWIQCNQYRDNTIYKNIIAILKLDLTLVLPNLYQIHVFHKV